jgi:hypothetical protein
MIEMDEMKEALKVAGWTDEIIQHFMQSDNVIVDRVDTVDLKFSVSDIQVDTLERPQKVDSTTFVVK